MSEQDQVTGEQASPKKVRLWTDEQKRAIDTTDRTLLLSAAAGSGKTATLTERLVRMITNAEHPLDVSRMLIVTFTRAAAAELRERIASALSDAIDKDPENAHLTRQSLLLPSAKIRTIDSFCNDLVKGHTEALDISPAYRIPDESENAVLARGVMDELLEDAYGSVFVPRGAGIAQVSECTVGAKNEQELATLLLSFYDKLQGYPEGTDLLCTYAERLEREAALPFFDTLWGGTVRELTHRRLTELKAGYAAAIRGAEMADGADSLVFRALGASFTSDLSFLQSTVDGLADGYEATRARLLSFSTPDSNGTAPDKKLSEESLRAKRYRGQCKDLIKKWAAELYSWREADIPEAFTQTAAVAQSIADLLSEYHRRYTQEKRRLSLCDYNDLEHLALSLLCRADGSKTPLAEQLTESFDAICIDEYQDVNEVQHRIFSAISTKTDRFMVGDIKQSIYGFRGAQPDIFAALRRTYPATDTYDADGVPAPAVYYLRANFRSEPSVLSLCNGVFDYLFGALGESIGYTEDDRLNPGRAPSAVPLPTLSVLPPKAKQAKETEEEELSEDEKEAPAEEVAEVVAHIRRILTQETHPDGRPYLPSEIAILLRSGKKRIAAYTEALQAAGIPVCTEDKQNFFTYPEILLALCLCHAVNNPRRDVYLAGLLRSPLYSFTMDELILIRRESRDGCLYDALRAYAAAHPESEKCAAFLSDLAAFREIAEGMATEKLLRHLFEKTGLYSITDAEGRHRLYAFYEFARRYEAASYHGLYRFLAYIEKLIAEERSVGGGRMVGESDGVQIVTVHHSKGLEYPVCFVCGLGSAFSHDDYSASLVFTPKLGLGLKLRDKETGLARIKTPIYAAIAAVIKQAGREEEARVLYVALTRAKERLHLYGTAGKKLEDLLAECDVAHACPTATTLLHQNSFLAWLLSALGTDSPLCRIQILEAASTEATEAPDLTESRGDAPLSEEATPDTDALIACLRARFEQQYADAIATELPGKLSVSLLHPAYLDEEEASAITTLTPPDGQTAARAPTVPSFISGIEKNAAALAGTATHVFLQFCRYDALTCYPTAEAAVDGELDRMLRERFMPAEEIARVRRDEAAAFLRSPLRDRIALAREVHRELRFHTLLPASLFTRLHKEEYAKYQILVQGVMDLIFVDITGRLVLLDYKTDRLTAAELADPALAEERLVSRHGVQLSCYAKAAERIFGRAPDEILIYSLHAGRAFPVKQILL